MRMVSDSLADDTLLDLSDATIEQAIDQERTLVKTEQLSGVKEPENLPETFGR